MGTECFTGGSAAQYSLPAVGDSRADGVEGRGAPTLPVGLSARLRAGNASSNAWWWGLTLVL
jgi:hypothetical protein